MVANPLLTEALRLLHEGAQEGAGLPVSACEEVGVDQESIEALRQAGFVEVVDDDGEPALMITEEGRALLRP